jgi:hypothetical protein
VSDPYEASKLPAVLIVTLSANLRETKPACTALRVSRATFYRRRSPTTGHQQPRPTPARALSEKERDRVFDTLCSDRFMDRGPAEVVGDAARRGRLPVQRAHDVSRSGLA